MTDVICDICPGNHAHCPECNPISAREAARRGQPLDGADAQALEGALQVTERERDEARNWALGLAEFIDDTMPWGESSVEQLPWGDDNE